MPESKQESETSLKVQGCLSGGCLGFLAGPLLCMLLLECWFHLRGYFFFQDMYWLLIACMPAGAALGALLLPKFLLHRARNSLRRRRGAENKSEEKSQSS